MKSIFTLLFLLLASPALFAQGPFPTEEQMKAFVESKTLVVLEDDPFSVFNAVIKKAVKEVWTITPYEFVTYDEFRKNKKDPAYSFLMLTSTAFEKDRDSLYFIAPITHRKRKIGAATVVLSTREMKSQLTSFKENLVFFIVIFVIAGCGILAWLISLFLRPLEELSSAAHEVGDGNLNVQADIKSKDEVGKLAITFNQMVINLNSAYSEIEEGYLQAVQSLALAVEAKDRYTKGHCDRVVFYSTVIAQHMDIPEKDIVELQLASQLHDVGKIGVPEAVLNKPGKLDPEEMRIIQKHPVIGYQILSPAKFLRGVAKLVVEHHERFDGNGYPNGKTGEEISILGRILCLADTFDALTSDRPYRKGMSLDKSVSIILDNRGSQFDPKLVNLFWNLVKEGELEYSEDRRDRCLLTDHLIYLRVKQSGGTEEKISTTKNIRID